MIYTIAYGTVNGTMTVRAVARAAERDAVNDLIDQIAGAMLTHLSGMSARCSRDMRVRRSIDAAVVQIRREISEACSKMADECNEPPLDDDT